VKATEILHERGQSLWLDNISRSLLDNGTIQRYIDSYSVTGLTSNRALTSSDRSQRLENAGARTQRLLWASTSTKDPNAPDTLYVHGLAAPFTINTMPDKTLEAFYDHGAVADTLPADGGNVDELMKVFADAGVDTAQVAAKLQSDGAKSFVSDWNELIDRIRAQAAAVA
jgi:transaldolase